MLDFENNITDYEDFDQLHLLDINEYRTVGSIIFIYITLMMVLHLPIIWVRYHTWDKRGSLSP
jgi:hypothetical protein